MPRLTPSRQISNEMSDMVCSVTRSYLMILRPGFSQFVNVTSEVCPVTTVAVFVASTSMT